MFCYTIAGLARNVLDLLAKQGATSSPEVKTLALHADLYEKLFKLMPSTKMPPKKTCLVIRESSSFTAMCTATL